MSLSQKIASNYLASQPLRLQPDYGERASNLANLYAKKSADFLADDLFAEDHEAEDWMAEKEADFDKYSRVKSHKHHSPKEVKDSYEAQKKNFGDEWAKYEGAMTEDGIEESVVQENLKEMGKSASRGPAVYIDDVSADRLESLALKVVETQIEKMRLSLPRGLSYEMINEAHLKMSPIGQSGPFYQVAVDMAGSKEDEFGRSSYDGTFYVLVEEGRVKKTSRDPFSIGKSASQMVREDFIDAKGKSGGLHDEIKVEGKKFFVSNIFYDLGRREIFVSYMDGRKQRSVPASEVVITKADPYRRASYDDEIIDDIGLGLMAGDESSGSYMSRQNLREIEDISGYVLDHIEDHEEDLELDDWVEDKISQGRSMIDDVYRHVTYGDRHQHQEDDDDEIIDDLGLDRMASDEIIDDIGLGRSLKRRRSF